MRKVLIFTAILLFGTVVADAASRDSNTTPRAASTTTTTPIRAATPIINRGTTVTSRATPNARTTSTTARAASSVVSRAATTPTKSPRNTAARTDTATQSRAASSVVSRAAAVTMSETRTGAEYERCKTAYFTCMDQFCSLKNDDYRRCSCSNRVTGLAKQRKVLQEAGQQLTVFTESLDVVGMTAAQASAMRTASEGENALTSDTSASKALLQAIMNSIRGGDTNVGGKYSDLNSLNISFDASNAFGVTDSGQLIASYDAQNLYNAVYPQCRAAVAGDCNNASLQRAITAYLMAIEQDCNTVQTAITESQSQMKAAIREGSAMLDLARVENRQKHNSDDIATCLANVEQAILSEEVCGNGYHRCLDNGEFIDISTGAPIAGVVRFYELEKLLTFSDSAAITDQRLSKIPNNRPFVMNFEKRTKKFAQPALDKCTEKADIVWEEYLDKAMLDIYYAQRAKVSEIKQGCFDFVSSCYMNGDAALTAAMKDLIGESGILVQPDRVALSTQLCRDYVESCNNMFDGNIIANYIENRQDTDTLTACRAVAQQCFDKYGGTNYENFYYPYSGLFDYTKHTAPDWFTLYEWTVEEDGSITRTIKSECAKQLAKIDSCKDPEMLVTAFGGLDLVWGARGYTNENKTDAIYYYGEDADPDMPIYGRDSTSLYGAGEDEEDVVKEDGTKLGPHKYFEYRSLRPTGIATEMYNKVIDILSTQCKNIGGRFVELQFVKLGLYDNNNICLATFRKTPPSKNPSIYALLANLYNVGDNEDMCPRNYKLSVDVPSWGACLCWENGGRRSKWGKSTICVAALPIEPTTNNDGTITHANDAMCPIGMSPYGLSSMHAEQTSEAPPRITQEWSSSDWCSISTTPLNQVCPPGSDIDLETGQCRYNNQNLTSLPDGLSY